VRKNLGIRYKEVSPELQEQSDQRVRTYKTLFQGMGLLYDDGGLLHVTPLGHRLREEFDDLFSATDDAASEISLASRWKLARLGGTLISRYQLANPSTKDRYPPDTDIFPLWAILFAMRSLDDKIHWEEVGRVLTKCLRMADLAAAISKIEAAREDPTYHPRDPESAERALGPRCPDLGKDQQDRIIVWLSRAGFKDLLIEHRSRQDGFRHLNVEFIPLVDEILETVPTQELFASKAAYQEWLGSPRESESAAHGDLLERITQRCRKVGNRFLIALMGPAGSGKTHYAEEAAKQLVDGDQSRWESIQFHASFTYEEFIGGLSPNSNGGFVPKPGVLLRLNERALKSDLPHVLVVDELSRADVANVLGELLTYVEYRGRPFRVAALDKEVRLAKNLIIIVTLNPADRSVINLDDAVVRRLRQIEVPRSSSALQEILDEAGMDQTLRDEVVSWFDGLPADVPFGHGLFRDVATHVDLHDLWHEQLRFFLRRGQTVIYPNPNAVEDGFKWRDERYAPNR
jgi:hypothetical protein